MSCWRVSVKIFRQLKITFRHWTLKNGGLFVLSVHSRATIYKTRTSEVVQRHGLHCWWVRKSFFNNICDPWSLPSTTIIIIIQADKEEKEEEKTKNFLISRKLLPVASNYYAASLFRFRLLHLARMFIKVFFPLTTILAPLSLRNLLPEIQKKSLPVLANEFSSSPKVVGDISERSESLILTRVSVCLAAVCRHDTKTTPQGHIFSAQQLYSAQTTLDSWWICLI